MVTYPILDNPQTMYLVLCCETLMPVGLYHSQAGAIRAGYACKDLREGFRVTAVVPGEACGPCQDTVVFESKVA